MKPSKNVSVIGDMQTNGEKDMLKQWYLEIRIVHLSCSLATSTQGLSDVSRTVNCHVCHGYMNQG